MLALLATVISACGGGGGIVTRETCSITSVSVSPSTANVNVGANVQLAASVNSTNCSPAPTTSWTSNASAVASVSLTGTVTGVSVGTATITATAGAKSSTAVISVTPSPVATVEVTPLTASTLIGRSVTLSAVTKDAQGVVLTGRALTWSSSNAAVASVSSGIVTGIAPGTATITAAAEGRSGTASVTVTNFSVASVTVASTSTTLVIGQSATASAVARAADNSVLGGRTVTWSSTNINVATINPTTGVLTGVAPGTTSIAATVDGVVGQLAVTVSAALENSRLAWAIVDDANATIGVSYVPNPLYWNNATGGEITAQRTSTGVYLVRFARLAKSGVAANRETVIVNSVGLSGDRCIVEGWDDLNPSDLQVSVTCRSIAGALQNAQFEIAVIGSNTLGPKYAFAWSNNATASAPTPAAYAFSPGGPPGVVNRTGTGGYIAFMGATGFAKSVALVSTYSSTASANCHVEFSNAVNGDVGAACRQENGLSAVDARFTVLLAEGGRTGKRWSFALSDDPSPAIDVTTTPSPANQAQSNGQSLTVRRTAVGTYFVTFTGLRRNAGTPEAILVSSYGGVVTGTCQTQAWGDSGTDMAVLVHCWDPVTGQKADTRFTILFME